jgi:hypothetical protein
MMKLCRLFLLSLALVSCTGTPEDEPPVFVLAGVINGDKAELILFEDRYRFVNDMDSTTRFKFFDRQDLPAPAVDFDIVDRVNTRSELIVLTRDDKESYIHFFSLLGIKTAANFTETTSKRINLAKLTGLPTDIELCPSNIQVTRDGTFAAILNVATPTCGEEDDIRLLIIDLKNRKYLRQVRPNIFPLSSIHPIIDQSSDILYFLSTSGGSGVKLNSLERSNFTSTESPSFGVRTYDTAIQTNTNQTDFMKLSSSFLTLNPSINSQSIYTYTTVSGDTLKNETIPTIARVESFIPDYTNQYTQVFILGNSRLAIHQNAETTTLPNRIEGSTTAMLGTINTFTDFLYLVSDNTIEVFDLLELQDNPSSIVLETETISDLNNPSILTWIQGVVAETAD